MDEAATGVPLTLTSRIEQTLHLLEPLRDAVEVRRTGVMASEAVRQPSPISLSCTKALARSNRTSAGSFVSERS